MAHTVPLDHGQIGSHTVNEVNEPANEYNYAH